MPIHRSSSAGIAEVVVDYPPVNALPVAAWFDLAAALTGASAEPATRVVLLRAEGRGFNAGVDIKELARAADHHALLAVNRGCAAAFAAVYECPVPVVVAVHGFCLGGGIGLVGNADIVVASEDATFGLPEVDRGALGAATHLARMVPPMKLRSMLLLAESATASELHRYGAIHTVVPNELLRDTSSGIAGRLAAKNPTVMRAAKEALRGMDVVDPRRSYRFEQGFTYELTLVGVAQEARAAFADGRGPKSGS